MICKRKKWNRWLAAHFMGIACLANGMLFGHGAVAHASDDASKHEVVVTSSTYTVDGETESSSDTVESVFAGVSGEGASYYAGIVGAVAEDGDASGNTLTISNVTVTGGEISAGFTSVGNANNNTTTVNNVDLRNGFLHGGYAYAGDGDANNNTVTMSGGTVYHIHGGHAHRGDANGNTVNIMSGTVTTFVGSGYSDYGNANNNVLNIYDGTVNGLIHGGYAPGGGNAIGNVVNIYGGTITGDIYGGWAPMGNAQDNVINVYGNPDLTGATLYAGRIDANGISSGNVLNINTRGITAQNIAGFQDLNFNLPSNIANGDTVLKLTDTSGTDLSSTTVNVNAQGGFGLSTGDTITLLQNENGLSVSNITNSGVLSEGVSMDYALNISENGGSGGITSIQATIGEMRSDGLKEQTDALAQPSLVALDLLNTGSDRILQWLPATDMEWDGEEWKDVSAEELGLHNEYKIFANMDFSSIRTKTGNGSHADVRSGGLDIGGARSIQNNAGRLTFAPIIDYGHGNYDNYSASGIRGKGHTHYTAGGFIARQMNKNGSYYEGSFRIGSTHTDFHSSDFEAGGAPIDVSYSASAPVYAAHVHVGRFYSIDAENTMQLYGHYFHNHQGSMSANLSTGERYHFDSVDSGRLRVGVHFIRKLTDRNRFYSGLAYQYEFGGESSASYKGYSTPESRLQGSSGMLELGWQIKPSKDTPWTVDVGAVGWVGLHKGFTIQAKLMNTF